MSVNGVTVLFYNIFEASGRKHRIHSPNPAKLFTSGPFY